MTIEGLELLAANLYKEAEEATPIIGGADKKDWMARRLEEIVEQKGPKLDELLACDRIDDVLDLLDVEYDDMKHPDEEVVIEDDLENTKEVDAPIINPVADTLGIEDTGTVRMDEPVDTTPKDAIVTPDNETEMPDDIILVEETIIIVEDDLPEEQVNQKGESSPGCGCREK